MIARVPALFPAHSIFSISAPLSSIMHDCTVSPFDKVDFWTFSLLHFCGFYDIISLVKGSSPHGSLHVYTVVSTMFLANIRLYKEVTRLC